MCVYKKAKSQKGITLTSLVIYIVVFVVIIGVVSNISYYFHTNVGKIRDYPIYISEFNKFSMFFIMDVKKNTEVSIVENDYLEFGDGTKYRYNEECIYRNDIKVADHILEFSFKQSEYTENSFTKQIINVKSVIGLIDSNITKDIDFVLKYW